MDRMIAELRQSYPCGEARPLGLGRRPAVIVVDFIEGFTNPESPLGGSWDREIEHTASLLAGAREAGVPVVYTTVELRSADLERNLLYLKTPRIGALLEGSRWTGVDHRLPPRDDDVIVSKQHGSAFFGTALASQLQVMGVDTVLLAGCVTSGCVRASAVDAAQAGFRPGVVREAVGDRSPLANETNLIDIEQRYGDVLSLEQALAYLSTIDR
ncbi:isochorismatase family protein [Elongatibacter sediminis]|uniref:Isochorismatase family protein n=1 Tax=Elongatibacter sediminis TaxID=3119006 RepID=A0AAW9RIA7_9GAMM